MVFNPSKADFDCELFLRKDWSFFIYTRDGIELKEEIPPYMPEPHEIGMSMRVYVDRNHAGNTITRRSRTGFIIFLNSAPIYWSTKTQGL